ncbi:MAG TPA: hypothetical protein VK785_01285 [Opitutaceae bacterium]|nr:hypothetical protein [Opitutaceae bacterium]
MNKSTKMILACAAVAGLYSGALALKAHGAVNHGSSIVKDTVGKASCNSKDGCSSKSSCKGQNACKGQGNCSAGDNGCKGKNSCKGHGGCKGSRV